MHPPPALSSRPLAAQLIIAGFVPAAFGALTGVMLGVSELAYLIFSLLGIAGGFFAGLEHSGGRAGARRGVLGGALFGAFILIAHEVIGVEAKAQLPHPPILLVAVTTLLGAGLGALGGRRRARIERSLPDEMRAAMVAAAASRAEPADGGEAEPAAAPEPMPEPAPAAERAPASEPEPAPAPALAAAPPAPALASLPAEAPRRTSAGRAASASLTAVWGLLWLVAVGLAAVAALLVVLAVAGVDRVF